MNLRSTVFAAAFYLWMLIYGTFGMVTFLISRRSVIRGLAIWSAGVQLLLRVIGGISVEVRGREHLPAGSALIAAKHQAMLDTLAPFTFLDDVCFVLKEELTKLPLFGWYCIAGGMVALDRGGQASALKALVRDTKDRLKEDRQIIIYPEGTRGPVGSPPDYKPGVAALYGALDMPCIPMATNSGLHWSHRGMKLTPGVVVFEFLPAIPAGLKRAEFMAWLEEAVETASNRLAAEGI